MNGKLIKKDGAWYVNHVVFVRKDIFNTDIPLHPADVNIADSMEKEYNDEVESRFNRYPIVEFTYFVDEDENNNKKILAKLDIDE